MRIQTMFIKSVKQTISIPEIIMTKLLRYYPQKIMKKTLVFDDMLGSKEVKVFDAFFTLGCHQKDDIFYISQSCYELPKNTIRINCSRIMLFPQTI